MEINKSLEKRIKNIAKLYVNKYGYLDYSKKEAIDTLIILIRNFFNKIYIKDNNYLIEFFDLISDEQFAELFELFHTYNISDEIRCHWIEDIINYVELNYSSIHCNEKGQTYEEIHESIQKQLLSSSTVDIDEIKRLRFLEKYIDLKQEIGTPYSTKRLINSNNYYVKFSFVSNLLYYNLFLHKNISYFSNSFPDYEKLLLDILSFACDELFVYVNTFFDSFFRYWENIDLLKTSISQITELFNKYNSKINDHHSEKDFNTFLHLEFLVYRNNRDLIYSKLDSLLNASDTSDKYNILNAKNIGINEVYKYLVESEKYDKRTIKNNIDLLIQLSNCIYLKSYINKVKDIPYICYVIDINSLVSLKILYHEFFTWSNEMKNPKDKHHPASNLTIKKIIKNMISTAENVNLNGSTFSYNEQAIFNDRINEKNTTRFFHSILLSEKIRRGFYREYNMMESYRLLFNFNLNHRRFLTSILLLNDYEFEAKIINEYFLDLKELFKELSITLQNKTTR